jgi:hypothetical protein
MTILIELHHEICRLINDPLCLDLYRTKYYSLVHRSPYRMAYSFLPPIAFVVVPFHYYRFVLLRIWLLLIYTRDIKILVICSYIYSNSFSPVTLYINIDVILHNPRKVEGGGFSMSKIQSSSHRADRLTPDTSPPPSWELRY